MKKIKDIFKEDILFLIVKQYCSDYTRVMAVVAAVRPLVCLTNCNGNILLNCEKEHSSTCIHYSVTIIQSIHYLTSIFHSKKFNN